MRRVLGCLGCGGSVVLAAVLAMVLFVHPATGASTTGPQLPPPPGVTPATSQAPFGSPLSTGFASRPSPAAPSSGNLFPAVPLVTP